MAIKFSNLASTTLASGVSSTATSVSVTSASSFPTLGSGDYFYATIGAGSGSEIVKVTGISGTTFTVSRGEDGTTAVSHSAGVDVALRVTAGTLEDLRDGGQVYTAGSGLGLSGNEFTNTAPDQTVSISGSGSTTVTGTYPSFTVSSTSYSHPSAHPISFITGLQTALDGKVDDSQVLTDVPVNALFTDTVYTLPFTDNSTNWNTAYGWGDHSTGGYLTSHQSLSGYATETYVGTQITNLVDSSPAALNTLNELAAALGDDPNFATTVTNSIALKAPLASPSFTGTATMDGLTVEGATTLTHSGTTLSVDRTGGATALIELKQASVIRGYLGADSTKSLIAFNGSGAEKFSVSNAGIDVTGTATMDGLTVDGTAIVSDSTASIFRLLNTGTTGDGLIHFGDSASNFSGVIQYNHDADYMALFTATQERLRITSAGNVNINTGSLQFGGTTVIDSSRNITAATADINGGASYPLQVSSTQRYQIQVRNPNNTTNGGYGWWLAHDTDFDFVIHADGAGDRLTLSRSGNLNVYASLSVGGTTVIDSSRNLTNIGTLNGGTAWRSNNDGSGSGLDADLLDGIDSSRVVFGTNTSKVYRWDGDWNTMFTTVNTGFIDNGSGTNGNPDGFTHHHGFQVRHSNMGNAWGFQFMGSYHPSYQSLYHRNVNAGTWSSWKEIWDSGNDGSGSGLDADLLDGYNTSTSATANTVVVRDSGGHIYGNYILGSYFNASSGNSENPTIGQIWTQSTGDDYLRKSTPAHLRSQLGLWWSGNDGSGSGLDADLLDGVEGSGYVKTDGSNPAFVKVPPNYTGNLNSISNAGVYFTEATGSVSNNPFSSSGSFLQFGDAGGVDVRLQFYAKSSLDRIAFRNQWGNGNWGGWHEFWTTLNDGSGSGLDADLLDGVHGASFLRSDATDTASGSVSLRAGGSHLGNHEFAASSTSTGYSSAAIELRESNYTATGAATPPILGFHWGGVVASTVSMDSGGAILIRNNPGTAYENFRAANIYANGTHLVWHTGNDGSGSGLDADLLDGQQGSYYAPATGGSYLPLAGGTLTGNLNTSGSGNYVLIGGSAGGNAYSTVPATTGLMFGGANDPNNYSIGTSTQNIGGNYTKLNIKWHTGIRFFSMPQYGGTRFYSDAAMSTETFSINNLDGNVRAANSLYANDVRASIFYDSASTGYYVDPAANSSLLGSTYGGLSIGEAPVNYDGWDRQLTLNGSGHARIHVKTASRRMGIYAHDSWHNGGGGYVGTYSNHNVTFIQNAVSAGYIDTSKNLHWQGGSVRAPIFYDSNDTSYYVDPSNYNSKMAGLNLYGGDSNNINDATLWVNKTNNADWGISVVGSSLATEYGIQMNLNGTHLFGYRGLVSGTEYTRIGTDLFYHWASVRAPIFYDSNDTGYYVDPNSSSYSFRGNGQANVTAGYISQNNPWSTGHSAFCPNGITTAGSTNWIYGHTYLGGAPSNGSGNEATAAGTIESTSWHKATVYYDRNDTGYYVDAASTSNINALGVQGTLTASQSTNTSYYTPNITSVAATNSAGVANYHLKFVANNGNANGSISTNYYQTTYATTSDYRAKEDFQPIINATSRLMSLNPVNFQWKDSDMRTDGFLAHEVAEVVSDAVVGEKDAVDEQGNDELQALDQSKLVPLLVKTIQEQQGVIEALEARISALEA